MKHLKKVLLVFFSLLVVAAVGFVIWAKTTHGPEPAALAALATDSQVTVTQDRSITFVPAGEAPTTGFVFYPGGRVDPRAYAAPLHRIAARGYLVVLLSVRLNLAMFDIDAAQSIFEQHPRIKNWAVGGHSLGGVASGLFAKKHANQLKGVIFWGSYPADDSLKNGTLKVLSIYGTNDMSGMAKFKKANELLPTSTKFVVLEGGNHAQFGDYGPQRGDFDATISRAEQQSQTIDAVCEFLKSLDP